MAWKQFTAPRTIVGPGRIALNSAAFTPGTDPADIAAIISASPNFVFNVANNWTDLGPTDGGTTISKGYTTTAYSHDLGNDVIREVSGNTMGVTATLAEAGLLSRFNYSWLTQTGTTGITGGVKKGLASVKTLPHRSFAAAEIDQSGRLRVVYLRDTTPVDQEAAYAMSPTETHKLPIALTAYADTSASDNEFGWIYEETNFGT